MKRIDLDDHVMIELETVVTKLRCIPPSDDTVIHNFVAKLVPVTKNYCAPVADIRRVVKAWPDGCDEGRRSFLHSLQIPWEPIHKDVLTFPVLGTGAYVDDGEDGRRWWWSNSLEDGPLGSAFHAGGPYGVQKKFYIGEELVQMGTFGDVVINRDRWSAIIDVTVPPWQLTDNRVTWMFHRTIKPLSFNHKARFFFAYPIDSE